MHSIAFPLYNHGAKAILCIYVGIFMAYIVHEYSKFGSPEIMLLIRYTFLSIILILRSLHTMQPKYSLNPISQTFLEHIQFPSLKLKENPREDCSV